MNADGSNQHALTAAVRTSENPAWSPDGRTIAFDTDRTEPGNLDVWTMNADGSNEHALIASIALDALPAYSPDGRSIAFVQRAHREERPPYLHRRCERSQHPPPRRVHAWALADEPGVGGQAERRPLHDRGDDLRRRPDRHAR